MRKLIFTSTIFLLSTFCTAQEPKWELFFPGISGPIAVDPVNSDVIYIASGTAPELGMWKTKDGGQSWDFYDKEWGMGSPRDILIDPRNSDVILVSGGPFVGLVKSIDGGETWVRADYGFIVDHHGYFITDLVFDSKNEVYYATDNGTFCGLFKSTDGLNWERVSNTCILSLVIDEDTGIFYGGNGGGVWKSEDDGTAWMLASNGLPFESGFNPVIWNMVEVKGSETLYCTVGHRGIYKSFDGGDNWFSVNDSITRQLDFLGGLTVSEVDTAILFAGSEAILDTLVPAGLYVSRNSGSTWEILKIGLPDSVVDVAAFQLFLNNNNNTLYTSMTLLFGPSQEESNIYQLKDAIITNLEENTVNTSEFQLNLGGYPNPFNSTTILHYSIPITGRVTIKIYNILGKEVKALFDEIKGPGEHKVRWDGTNQFGKKLSSGIYLALFQIGKEYHSIKLLMLN